VRMSPMRGGRVRASRRIGHDRGGDEDSERYGSVEKDLHLIFPVRRKKSS
jgi:hypothetical protein